VKSEPEAMEAEVPPEAMEGAGGDSAATTEDASAVVAGGDDEPVAEEEGEEAKGAEGAGEEAKALAVRPQDGEAAAAAEAGDKGEAGFAIAEEEEDDDADMGNSAAWTKMLMEAIAEPMPGAREKFEKIVTAFPTAATYWKPYLEKEMASGADGKVGPLFERCLRQCCSKELWRLYLRYVKQGAAAGQNARDELKTAYAFVAQHYGMDIGAAWFWHECVPLFQWLHLLRASACYHLVSAVRVFSHLRPVLGPDTSDSSSVSRRTTHGKR
jgi:hypothetical protein